MLNINKNPEIEESKIVEINLNKSDVSCKSKFSAFSMFIEMKLPEGPKPFKLFKFGVKVKIKTKPLINKI